MNLLIFDVLNQTDNEVINIKINENKLMLYYIIKLVKHENYWLIVHSYRLK